MKQLTCMRKVRYRSEESAKRIATIMHEKHGNWIYNVYRCDCCEFWHIGRGGLSPWFKKTYAHHMERK